MLERQIVSSFGRQHGRRNRTSTHRLGPGGTLCLVSLAFRFVRGVTTLSWLLLIVGLRGWMCGTGSGGGRCGRLAFQIPAFLVVPRGLVVGFLVLIETGVQAVFRQLEAFFDDEGGIRVVDEVVVRDPIILDRVIDNATQKRDIGSGANL